MLWVSLESPLGVWWGDSNEYPQHMIFQNTCCGYSLESPMFLWRTIEKYPLIILKYMYLLICSTGKHINQLPLH